MNGLVENNTEAILNYCREAADAMRAGKADRALTQLTRAFSLAYDSDNPRLSAYVLNALAHAYFETGNLQRAEECFSSALKTASDHPDMALTAAAGLARTLQATGNHTGAVTYFQEAVRLAETVGNGAMAATLKSEMAGLVH